MKFSYRGVTKDSLTVTGHVEAVDTSEAQLKLRAMKIRPKYVKPVQALVLPPLIKRITLGKVLDRKGLFVFTRQFSSLIDAGVPVVQCLDILYQQEHRPKFKQVLLGIKKSIEEGSTLADGLRKYPYVFNNLFIRLVEAGEVSGTLDQALKRIGIHFEKIGRLRAKVIAALTYPIVTLVVAVAVLILLLVKVIPEVSKLYSQASAELPEITQFVLSISTGITANLGALSVGVVLLIFSVWAFFTFPGLKPYADRFTLSVPLIGMLIKKSLAARLSRTLSTLITSGVPLLNAFQICQKVISNDVFVTVIKHAATSVAEGKALAVGLAHKNLFSPMFLHMVSIGEVTGKLDEMLTKLSDIYDDEVDDLVNTITGLLQPGLIIFVGGIIAFILMAMYLPIFQLAEKVTGGM